MHKSLITLILISFFYLSSNAKSDNLNNKENYSPLNYQEVAARLKTMPCLIKPKDTPAVRSFIRTYLETKREHSKQILGRTVIYFPMYEKKFREHDMPEELKYLSIVESALKPKAVSRVGAGGLWQFMPETGKYYGLHINEHRDDRSDPEMATEAAIAYLKDAYKRFGSWELAIASYNSGPGRVNRAVRRSRSKNFWTLKRYLPRETRSYVPGFIAATYLCQYFAEHGVTPEYPSLDMQMTRTVKIYNHLDFGKIQQLTGLSQYVIEDLNPAYTANFIPANSMGYSLTLPRRVMQRVLDYLQHVNTPDSGNYRGGTVIRNITINPKPINLDTHNEYYKSIYYVNAGESMEQVAKLFEVSKNSIMAWNNLNKPVIYTGQRLILYHPNEIERWQPKKAVTLVTPIAALSPRTLDLPRKKEINLHTLSLSTKVHNVASPKLRSPMHQEEDHTTIRGNNIYYRVQEGDTLQEIADKFPGVRLEDLYELNRIKKDKEPKAGSKIKVKRL